MYMIVKVLTCTYLTSCNFAFSCSTALCKRCLQTHRGNKASVHACTYARARTHTHTHTRTFLKDNDPSTFLRILHTLRTVPSSLAYLSSPQHPSLAISLPTYPPPPPSLTHQSSSNVSFSSLSPEARTAPPSPPPNSQHLLSSFAAGMRSWRVGLLMWKPRAARRIGHS